MKAVSRIVPALALCCAVTVPALALGPVDGEFGAVWWAHDVKAENAAGAGSADGDAPGFHAELWMFDKYGVRADQFSSEPDGAGASGDSMSVDLMWRPYSPAENTFVAVGLGWQTIDLQAAGLDGDTSGARLAVEGRIGLLGQVYAYGHGAYSPHLDDAADSDPLNGEFEDVEGYEVEVGVAWRLAPFISMRAGYRANSLDFVHSGATVLTTTATGAPSGDATAPPVLGRSPDPFGSPEGVASSVSGSAEAEGVFAGLTFHF
jgi:hypothetical protein